TAFRSRWLNDTVAEATGFLLLLPPRWFRAFHMAHHRYTQDPDRDPELARPPVGGIAVYLWRLSGLPFWQDAIVGLVRRAAGRADAPFLNAQSRPDSIREARIYLAAYAGLVALSLAAGTDLLLWLWVLPALLGQPALRWFLMAEHTGCPEVADMRHNTRTTLTRAPLRFLCWNMCWHAEHHIAPAVPFFALPLLHRSIKSQLSVVQPGYFDFHTGLIRRLNRPTEANSASEAR
nr:fatty acid desaturase [Alphaproteobacteria bacterium]